MTGIDSESGAETEGPVVRIRRWYMVQNRSRREMQDQQSDVYGGGGATSGSGSNVFPEIVRKESAEEEPWKANKKGKAPRVVDNNHQLYVSQTELRMYQPSHLPLWEWDNCRFVKLVLDVDEESNGEMEIEKIKGQTIEARTRGSHPVWG
ncbi:BnaA02g09470D [Brassica napus]|uniref:BnaA02g09470D protein n=2 Tax=Brassica napus TaxID=3708 RepID=A0A078GQD1_BRANA|nr:BnaA02g09470D [Brassica napus]